MQEGVLRKSGLEEAFGLWEEMRLFGFGVVEGATLNVVETAIHLDCNNFYLGLRVKNMGYDRWMHGRTKKDGYHG